MCLHCEGVSLVRVCLHVGVCPYCERALFIPSRSDWTELFPYDFRDERMMRELRDITKKLAALSVVGPTHLCTVCVLSDVYNEIIYLSFNIYAYLLHAIIIAGFEEVLRNSYSRTYSEGL